MSGHAVPRRASMQAFRRFRAATRGLIAAPWTPLASLCSRARNALPPGSGSGGVCFRFVSLAEGVLDE